MSEKQPGNLLLFEWSKSLLYPLFKWAEYRDVRQTATSPTLLEQLARELMVPLDAELARQQIVLTPRVLQSLLTRLSGRNLATAPLHQSADDLARVHFLTRFHGDLVDADGFRHDLAKTELWTLAREQLERGSFYGAKTPGFWVMREKAALLSIEPEELFDEFWKCLWPELVTGDNIVSHPAKLYGYVQTKANGFISHQVRDFNLKIKRIHQQWERGERGFDAADTPLDELIENLDAIGVGGTVRWYQTESAAMEHVEQEEILRGILDAYVAGSDQNRLGFLIHLFRTWMMPNVTGLNTQFSGKNQQIAAVLQHWRSDPAPFFLYLTDDLHGLDLGADLAREIMAAVAPGFAEAGDPITPEFVTTLFNRFNEVMRLQLQRFCAKLKDPTGLSPDAEPPGETDEPSIEDHPEGGDRG